MIIYFCPKCLDYYLGLGCAMPAMCDRCNTRRNFVSLNPEETAHIKDGGYIKGEESLSKEAQIILEKIREHYIYEYQIWKK